MATLFRREENDIYNRKMLYFEYILSEDISTETRINTPIYLKKTFHFCRKPRQFNLHSKRKGHKAILTHPQPQTLIGNSTWKTI